MNAPDPRFLGGETAVITDTSQMAFTLVIGFDGACDMRAGDGVSKQQAAAWLRMVANSLDPGSCDPE